MWISRNTRLTNRGIAQGLQRFLTLTLDPKKLGNFERKNNMPAFLSRDLVPKAIEDGLPWTRLDIPCIAAFLSAVAGASVG